MNNNEKMKFKIEFEWVAEISELDKELITDKEWFYKETVEYVEDVIKESFVVEGHEWVENLKIELIEK